VKLAITRQGEVRYPRTASHGGSAGLPRRRFQRTPGAGDRARLGGKDAQQLLETFGAPGDRQALFVIRGRHCPICTAYLGEIEKRRAVFAELGVSLAAVSADSEAPTRLTAEAAKPGFPLLHGMEETTMRGFGLYISEPRSAQETDHHVPEPALCVVNPDGALKLLDVANALLRPDLDRLVGGLRFAIEKGCPMRGTLE